MSEMRSESDPTAVLPRRIAAFIIDTIILGAFASIMLLPGLLFIAKGDVEPATDVCVDPPGVCFMSADNSQVFFADNGNALAAVLLPVLLWLLMHVVLQGLTGATPGKALMGLRTVKTDGLSVLGVGKAFARALPAIVAGVVAAAAVFFLKDSFTTYSDAQAALGIPALVVLAGSILSLALALVTSGHKGIGDRIAGTSVIGKQFLGQPGSAVFDPTAERTDDTVDVGAALAGTTAVAAGGAATAFDIPETPAPQMPPVDIVPNASDLFGTPTAPAMPDAPGMPDVPDVPSPSGLFASADAPAVPDTPVLPNAPGMPDFDPTVPAAAPDFPSAPAPPTNHDVFSGTSPIDSTFDPTLPEAVSPPPPADLSGASIVPDGPAPDPFSQPLASENPFDPTPQAPEPSILDSFGAGESPPPAEPVDMEVDPFAPAANAPLETDVAAQQSAAQQAQLQAREQQAAAAQQQAQQETSQQQAQQAAGVDGPQWDEARGTYIQWDPVLKAWMQWDQPGGRWIPIRT